MSQSQQERLHRQKWKIWNQQKQKQKIKKTMNVQEGIENYAVNLIQKMNSPFEKQNDKQNKQLNKQISNQIQSNVCSICLDLMIPPDRQPMILFPCGHNLCKECLFQHPPKGQIRKGLVLKLNKCTLCRQKIQSYAMNQSLMTLICTYSNNKDLLEKERVRIQEEEQKNIVQEDIQQLRIRCNILQKQQRHLNRQSQRFLQQKTVVAEVIDTLKKEKKKNQREMDKLEEEAKLISKCLTEKLEEMQIIQKTIKDSVDRKRVLDKALVPLKKQKQKQELLQIARIVNKK